MQQCKKGQFTIQHILWTKSHSHQWTNYKTIHLVSSFMHWYGIIPMMLHAAYHMLHAACCICVTVWFMMYDSAKDYICICMSINLTWWNVTRHRHITSNWIWISVLTYFGLGSSINDEQQHTVVLQMAQQCCSSVDERCDCLCFVSVDVRRRTEHYYCMMS